MTSTTFLQIFLFINVFVMGAAAAMAVRHAYAHYRPPKHETEKPPAPDSTVHIPEALKERLLHASEAEFQKAVSHSVGQLQRDLSMTADQINDLIRRLAADVVNDELQRYRAELNQLHQQAVTDMGIVKQEMSGHETELKAKLAQEMELEKQRLIKQIDTKLADAVASFLTEALQHSIDLGNQNGYLIALLEEHKADFVKEVGDEAATG